MTRAGWNVTAMLAGIALCSCSAVGMPIEDLASEINATRDVSKLVIQPGDTIELRFWLKPDWTQTRRVRPDGFATFDLIDEMKVAGLTIAALDERLTELYQKQGKEDISVDVIPGVERATAQVVYVVGEVQEPGAFALDGRTMTLIEAIGEAGGHIKDTANLSNTILVRRLARTEEMRSWRLDADIYTWGQKPAIFLQAGDIVFVPNTAIDEVNIWIDKYIRQNLPFPYLIPAGV